MLFSIRKNIKGPLGKKRYLRGSKIEFSDNPSGTVSGWIKQAQYKGWIVKMCADCEKVLQECDCYKKEAKEKPNMDWLKKDLKEYAEGKGIKIEFMDTKQDILDKIEGK